MKNQIEDDEFPLQKKDATGKYGYVDREGVWVISPSFEEAREFSHGVAIVKINGKYGYLDKNGDWFADPQFDDAYEFENGRAVVCKDGFEGWLSLDEDEGDYLPWTQQYQVLREIVRKNERKKKIRRMFGLRETVPIWLDYNHSWIPNRIHYAGERLKKDPAIIITIIIVILSFLYFRFVD